MKALSFGAACDPVAVELTLGRYIWSIETAQMALRRAPLAEAQQEPRLEVQEVVSRAFSGTEFQRIVLHHSNTPVRSAER